MDEAQQDQLALVRTLKGQAAMLEGEIERLKGGGGGGTSGGVEERVTRLETHMEYVRRDLDSINGKLDKLVDRSAEMPTKADLNTWRWQWLATGLAIVALTVGGITGGLALIARFAG